MVASISLAAAADSTGKWTLWTFGQGGNPAHITLNLKQDGNKLSGSVSSAGRNGPSEVQISNGKVEGSQISFEVQREVTRNTVVQKYEGTVSGDEMKLTITRQTGNGSTSLEVTARRRCPADCG